MEKTGGWKENKIFFLKKEKKKSINMDITRDLKLYEAESACVCMSLQSLLLGFKCIKNRHK